MTLHFIKSLTESADRREIKQNKLTFAKDELDPVMSEATIKYHYDGLASKYFERYNAGEGDAKFNFGGGMLHNLFFGNLTPARAANKPSGLSKSLIDSKYENFDKFKEAVEKEAMAIQGSGWVYLARNGQIKTIKNHQMRSDIVLLIDWWEHAWALDYQSDKLKYLSNTWRIIDWRVINSRLTVDLNQ
jgi:Fe-Mn family superoxide dismutase